MEGSDHRSIVLMKNKRDFAQTMNLLNVSAREGIKNWKNLDNKKMIR